MVLLALISKFRLKGGAVARSVVSAFLAGLAPVGLIVSAQEGKWEEEAGMAMEGFTLPDGFRVEVFADSAQVQSPSAICFDGAGRLFAAEIHRWKAGVEDIRHHPGMLLEDLGSRRTEERLAMLRKAAERGEAAMGHWTRSADRIRVLTDSDGDGRADRSGVFADGFDHALDGPGAGLLAGQGGIYYANIPHLWWLGDADGDGVSEGRESLQDGFGVRMSFGRHDLRGLIWGPDGRIYWVVGDRGYALKTREGKELRDPVGGAVFRCEPDGSKLEVYCEGLRSPQELAFDERGNLFLCDHGSNAWDESRLVYVMEGGNAGWHAGHQVVLHYHQALGLRTPVRVDARDGRPRALTAWLAEGLCLLAHEGQPAWILPAVANVGWNASGLVYNPGGAAFPVSLRDSFFLCNLGGVRSDVEIFSVKPAGAGFVLREHQKTWMAGAANTDAEFAPDGRLYLSCLGSSGDFGQSGGAVYTVFRPDLAGSVLVRETRRLLAEPLAEKGGAELADWLSHEDLRVRLRAQFELARRGEEALPLLEGAVNQRLRPLRRLHGIWGFGQIARATGSARAVMRLVEATGDPEPEVRAQAAKALADVEESGAGWALQSLLCDESPRVRAFACLGLGRMGRVEAKPGLLQVLEENADADPFLRHAAVVGLASLAGEEDLVKLADHQSEAVRRAGVVALRRQKSSGVRAYLRDGEGSIVREAVRAIHDLNLVAALPDVARLLDETPPADFAEDRQWLHPLRLINANWRLGTEEAALRLARFASQEGNPAGLRIDALRALEEWRNPSAVDPVTGLHRPLLPEGRAEVDALCRDTAGRILPTAKGELLGAAMRLGRRAKLDVSVQVLKGILQDPEAGAAARVEALEELSRRRTGGLRDLLQHLVADGEPRVRGAAVRTLLRLAPDRGMESALALLAPGEERAMQEAVRALATAADPRAIERLGALFDKVAAGQGEPAIWLELLEAAEQRPELADRWMRYLASLDPANVLNEYRPCLAGGDPQRGERIYANQAAGECNRCHTAGRGGGVAGPNLTEVGARLSAGQILESLVNPSARIAPGYGLSVLRMQDGTSVGGIMLEETEARVRIRTGPAERTSEVARENIAGISHGVSAMPAASDRLSKSELRDLVAFLSSRKGSGESRHFGLRIGDCGLSFRSAIRNPHSAIASWIISPGGQGGADRSHDHGENLLALGREALQASHVNDSILDEKLHPVERLVAFFLHRAHLRDEIRPRLGSCRRPVIGAHRCPSTKQLTADHLRDVGPWQIANKADHPERVSLGPFLEIFRVHGGPCSPARKSAIPNADWRLRTADCSPQRSAILNPKSAIGLASRPVEPCSAPATSNSICSRSASRPGSSP